MQFKSFVSTALLLGVVALSPAANTNQATAAPTKKPYCTAASKQGAYWWTWTKSPIEKACYTAFFKILEMGQSVDKATKGYYAANGLNKGKLSCKQGTKQVVGSGKLVFENGINTAKRLNWNGCTFRIINET
ncbi:MAG: hypothetical protein QNJ51_28465 [Calothrix sp. MO_167.B12]|nr:hypothetical protein [Calothrix sp. MO_167.B12]